ncbi:MAG: carbohydrate binding domain-containing protein [Phycisphaerae bacterium]|nr:carbohydrate binding domain-containing protein [Phycisphaerae bacterium]
MKRVNMGMKIGVRLGVLAMAATAGVAHAEVITNGSFEGGLAPWQLFNFGNADFEYATNVAHTGACSVRFGAATPDPTTLAQDAILLAGQKYHVSLWVLNYGAGDDYLEMKLYHTLTMEQELFSGFVPTGLESWEEISFDFTAVADTDWLAIRGLDQNASFYVDDVSIALIPAPAGAATLTLAGLLAARRRR